MKYFHRFIFYTLLVGSFVWACFALKTNPFILLYNLEFVEMIKFTYIMGLTVVFWPIFYVEICDLFSSFLGKNGRLYKSYLNFIKKDVVISFVAALVLMSIYWTDNVPYNFSGIDIGFVGGPFVIAAIYSVFQMMNIKIAGKLIRRLPLFIQLAVIIIFGVLAYSYLNKNSSGQFEAYQAIWFQITILCGSFFIFLSTSLQLFFLRNGKFELSKFKLYFFRDVIKSKHNIYESFEEPVKAINKRTERLKAQNAASKRRKKK